MSGYGSTNALQSDLIKLRIVHLLSPVGENEKLLLMYRDKDLCYQGLQLTPSWLYKQQHSFQIYFLFHLQGWNSKLIIASESKQLFIVEESKPKNSTDYFN